MKRSIALFLNRICFCFKPASENIHILKTPKATEQCPLYNILLVVGGTWLICILHCGFVKDSLKRWIKDTSSICFHMFLCMRLFESTVTTLVLCPIFNNSLSRWVFLSILFCSPVVLPSFLPKAPLQLLWLLPFNMRPRRPSSSPLLSHAFLLWGQEWRLHSTSASCPSCLLHWQKLKRDLLMSVSHRTGLTGTLHCV